MADGSLNVIALVSGGKDSFFSILHCLANGHRVVALANLHPPDSRGSNTNTNTTTRDPPGLKTQQHGSSAATRAPGGNDGDETDLNSFMYQTVGHQVIPLYAQATGLPLFRQPILGTAVHDGLSYQDPRDRPSGQSQQRSAGGTDSGIGPQPGSPSLLSSAPDQQEEQEEDETESLVPLLRAVLKAHPEANALCTGAILSTYQRTRVESVALRLGLVPLAYLWQFPELPSTPAQLGASSSSAQGTCLSSDDDAQLLRDMAAVGLEARIVKVASAGLDEDFLWENVASEAGVGRIERALRRFGGGGRGSVLGEGGEFETLVVDGPPALFKGRIVVREEAKRVVREGGGSVWLSIRDATVEMMPDASRSQESEKPSVRIPELLDLRFKDVLPLLRSKSHVEHVGLPSRDSQPTWPALKLQQHSGLNQDWCYYGSQGGHSTVEDQTTWIVNEVQKRLGAQSLPANAITNTVIILRRMSDFPLINKVYGSLFHEPNPPSRVTISCGDVLLPQDAFIAIYLTVQPRLNARERRGLHVQSRSYWAPANIGPYSQAIASPLLTSIGDNEQDSQHAGSPLAVCIAGQIPLLPASMVLPSASSPDCLELQVTLALQHLWRVGVEMQVQWWSSAVAYFPSTPSLAEMKHKALHAESAWRTTHLWSGPSDSDDEDEAGPDLWDRRYNPAYRSYAGDGGSATSAHVLPNWEVLKGFDADESQKSSYLPIVFSAEVEELPRQAGVEWHAHVGFANVGDGSVQLCSVDENDALSIHHVIVEYHDGVFVQTTAILNKSAPRDRVVSPATVEDTSKAVAASLAKMISDASTSEADLIRPKTTYADSMLLESGVPLGIGALVPCRSLWDSRGNRLAMVTIYETRFGKVGHHDT